LFPKGWEEGEKREILKKRRTYYEVTLHDWIVRHDLDGDGIIMKTVEVAGTGYDRCQEFDDTNLDITIYQRNEQKEFLELYKRENLQTKTGKKEDIFRTVEKILNSMKRGEHSSSVVHPSFFEENDQAMVKQLNLDTSKILKIDIKIHSLEKVEDLYKDRTTFYKTLQTGFGTASPRPDYLIHCKFFILSFSK